jgi:hypothetical protein
MRYIKGSVFHLCVTVNGNGHSFALKGQHKPARRNAAGNDKHDQRPERAVD